MELMTFAIPAYKKETVRNRLEKLVKKAIKYGNPDINFSFGKTFFRVLETERGKLKVEYINIAVSGDAPIISGWNLLARIELEFDENLIHRVPGSNSKLQDDYRFHDGQCDHCKTLRRRNDVYILSDGEQELAVGRSCLRDFLGIDDPKALVERAQFFQEITSISDEDLFSGGGSQVYSLSDVLLISAAFTREFGYCSKSSVANSGGATTAQMVQYNLIGNPKFHIETMPEDKDWAEKTKNFFRVTEFFDNEYLDNIRVIMKQDIVNERHLNLVVSSVAAVQRHFSTQDRNEQAKAESDFVGEVKSRLKGLEVTLEKVIFLGTGVWGPSYLHLLKDGVGNVFSWITGNKLEFADGSKFKLDASVKEHKVYNNIKQTVLTRGKLIQE